MHIYVRRGGPNYQTGLAKMRALGEELGVPLEVITMDYIFSPTCVFIHFWCLRLTTRFSCYANYVVGVSLVHFLLEERTHKGA